MLLAEIHTHLDEHTICQTCIQSSDLPDILIVAVLLLD